MNDRPVNRRLLATNTVLNVLGYAIPAVVAFLVMPLLVSGLGAARFGVLALAWVVFSYLGDIGFERAATRFAAAELGSPGIRNLSGIAWTTSALQLGWGVLGGGLLAVATPLLVTSVLRVPVELQSEAHIAFYLAAAALPAVLAGSSFRGVLEAGQRFDLVNAIKIPASAANFILPVVGVLAGWHLPGIIALLVAARVLTFLGYYFCARAAFAELRGPPVFEAAEVRRLVRYGSWVTVSSLVSPVVTYLDRFLLGALISMAAVTYYTAPYELVTRLWIVPVSVAATLFPAFSTLHARQELDRLAELSARALKWIAMVLGPLIVLLLVGARTLLELWLGPEFARESTLALQILAVGVLVNALARVPHALLHGAGRPDLTAKFHLLELPIQVVLVWACVRAWGIPGAALAWTGRVTLDAVLLFTAASRLWPAPRRLLAFGARVAS